MQQFLRMVKLERERHTQWKVLNPKLILQEVLSLEVWKKFLATSNQMFLIIQSLWLEQATYKYITNKYRTYSKQKELH